MATDDPRLHTPQWKALRLWVLDRDRGVCQIHGPKCTVWATDVDHIVARADGGDVWAPGNLRAACRQCNGWHAAQRTNRMRYRDSVARFETRL
jgi:5-methylcytosine-specific restriction endonuclease McrA